MEKKPSVWSERLDSALFVQYHGGSFGIEL